MTFWWSEQLLRGKRRNAKPETWCKLTADARLKVGNEWLQAFLSSVWALNSKSIYRPQCWGAQQSERYMCVCLCVYVCVYCWKIKLKYFFSKYLPQPKWPVSSFKTEYQFISNLEILASIQIHGSYRNQCSVPWFRWQALNLFPAVMQQQL